MAYKYSDNYSSTIASIAGGTGITSFTVASATGFPTLATGDFTVMRIDDAGGAGVSENVICTAIAGTTVTCLATGISHSAGNTIDGAIISAAALNQIKSDALSGYPETVHTGAGALTVGSRNLVTLTAADATMTLANGTYIGQVTSIVIGRTSTKRATIDPAGGTTIDGVTTRIMWAGERAWLSWDGTEWQKIGGLSIPMRAVMHLNASPTAIATGVDVKLLLDHIELDLPAGFANTTNSRLDVPRPGTYTVLGIVHFAATALGTVIAKGVINGGATGTTRRASTEGSISDNEYAVFTPHVACAFTLGEQITLCAWTTTNTRDVIGGFITKITAVEHPTW